MTGVEIIRKVYQRLRRPSQQALPYQDVVSTVWDVVARKRLDLSLSSQNAVATVSPWFTPSGTDFSLSDLGLNVMFPIRVETRAIDSEYEIGDQVPIVNFGVLDTSDVGGISFYGDPLRMAFRDGYDYVTGQQYRIVYEEDWTSSGTLSSHINLPHYFSSMVALEAAYELLEQIQDSSPEWVDFVKLVRNDWAMQIADKRTGWDQFVRSFKGRAQVPKRTFLDNRRGRVRTRYFKG